jgi:predicted RNase H-like HicB family nuclease
MQVVALIHEGNGEYAAAFPDFPGVIAAADSTEAVIVEAARLLAAEVDAMIEDGLELPPVRSLSELSTDPAFREDAVGAMVALVPCATPADVVRVSIAIERSLRRDIDRAAEIAGQTRSKFVAEAVRQRLAAADLSDAEEPAPAPIRPDEGAPTGRSPDDVRVIMESIRRSLAVINQTPAAAPGPQDATKQQHV